MFPDPLHAPHDIVAIGGALEVDLLVEAYRKGIFPWPMEELPLPWFSPRMRAILDFDELHISRSLRRTRRRTSWSFSIDRDFEGVIRDCASVERPNQEGTWITEEIIEAYLELHSAGYAHSAEVWDGDRLVGGIYGVDPGGAFSGESMFYHEPNASKLALLHLVDHLRSRGLAWLDLQVMTPHMRAFGGRTIPRGEFLDRLSRELQVGRELFG